MSGQAAGHRAQQSGLKKKKGQELILVVASDKTLLLFTQPVAVFCQCTG